MKKEEPILNFNDIETVKKLLGQGLNPANADNPDAVEENHATGQTTLVVPTPRRETIEEETHYKRPALEPLDE